MSQTTSNDLEASTSGTGAPTSNTFDDSPASMSAPKRPAPLACVECRGKHLKCDGRAPCMRCRQSSLKCIYQKSRRGYKGPRRSGRSTAGPAASRYGIADVESTMSRIQSQGGISLEDISQTNVDASEFLTELQNVSPDFTVLDVNAATRYSESTSSTMSFPLAEVALNNLPAFDAFDLRLSSSTAQRAVDAYYTFCHAAHPFLLPSEDLMETVPRQSLQHLLTSMCFIASCHVNFLPYERLYATLQSLSLSNIPKTGFSVQALLIYAIALNAQCKREEAAEALSKALNMALEIGMNKQQFSVKEGQDNPVLQESWRRTWWELYCVDGMSAGALQARSFELYAVPTDVLLPCEEGEYLTKRIPIPRSLKEYDEAPFTNHDIIFSSYTYRIDALRNLGKILSLPAHHLPTFPATREAQLSLANWRLHLPRSKEDLMTRAGHIDEMLFQAQMITNASTILLHKPHSSLYNPTTTPITSCAMVETSSTQTHDSFYASASTHSALAIQSANAICDLINLPTRITLHTPFFTCITVVASIVHTAQWASCMEGHNPCPARQHLQLDLGALKGLSGAWPLAKALSTQMQGVVADVFAAKEAFSEAGREALDWGQSLENLENWESLVENAHS